MTRCAQVERPTGMMFAATGHGADAQDFFDGLAARKFAADDQRLSGNAPKRGKRDDGDAVRGRCGLQASPRGRRARGKAQNAAIVRSAANEHEPPCLGVKTLRRSLRDVGGNSELRPELADFSGGHGR